MSNEKLVIDNGVDNVGAILCHAERSRTLRLSRVQNKFTYYAEAEQGRGTQASPRSRQATTRVDSM